VRAVVWLVWIRVESLPGCRQVPQPGSDELECALELEHEEKLRATLDEALRPHRHRVAEIQAKLAFRATDWDDRSDPESRVRAAAAAAIARGGVQFTWFGCAPPATSARDLAPG